MGWSDGSDGFFKGYPRCRCTLFRSLVLPTYSSCMMRSRGTSSFQRTPCLPRRPPKLEPPHLKTATDEGIADADAVVAATAEQIPPKPPDATAISPRPRHWQTDPHLIRPPTTPPPTSTPPPQAPMPPPTTTKTPRRPSAGYAPNPSSTTPSPRATIARATCVRCACARCTRSSSVRFARWAVRHSPAARVEVDLSMLDRPLVSVAAAAHRNPNRRSSSPPRPTPTLRPTPPT